MMIFDNEEKTKKLKNVGPMVDVNEAIYGTYNSHITHQHKPGGVPLGTLNQDRDAKQALAAHI